MALQIGFKPYIINAYAALVGEKPGNAALNDHLDFINAPGVGLTGYKAALEAYLGSTSSAALATSLLTNLGLTGLFTQAEAEAFLAGNPGNRAGAIIDLSMQLYSYNGPSAELLAAKTAYASKIDASTAYSNSAANVNGESLTPTAGNTFMLTSGMDNLHGTAFGDHFIANILNNANTAQSGDKIDGGAGSDRLSMDIGNSASFAITMETTSVETVAVRAQAIPYDTNQNNMYTNQVQIDAQRMDGVTQWESNNSRADVVIEDVRIQASQITKDITIAMVETDPGHVDFGVYFDQLSLRNSSSDTSQLNLQVMDTRSVVNGTAPLLNSPYGGFVFTATNTATGESAVITLQSDAIDNAQTYAELATAFQAALDARFTPGSVTATVGTNFTVTDTTTATPVTGQEIKISTNGAFTFTTPTGSGWIANGVVPANSGLHTNFNTTATTSTELVTSKVILDDVGRGSVGGDLVIGGLSVGDTSSSKGVERFEIEVRDNSKLQTINSTNNTLKEVTIVNGLTTSQSSAYVKTVKDAGKLTVNGTVGATTGENEALPGTAAQHNAFGFSDVRLIDGSAMRGDLAFTAEITSSSIAKYLNLKDGAPALPAADNVAFVHSGGTGNDTLAVTIDGSVLASTNTLTGREDFTYTLNGGAGNDSLTLTIDSGAPASAWAVDQAMLKNVSISGGDGNDTIRTPGAGVVKIDAGSGNDTVYTDNSGSKAASWFVSAVAPVAANLEGIAANNALQFLYKGKMTVTFAAPSTAASVTLGDAAPLTNGYEVVVDIPTGANYSVNQYHINQAIKAAINGDAVLSKLLSAVDGPANTLVITSLTDGTYVDNDLLMTVSAPDVSLVGAGGVSSATEQATVLAAYKAFLNAANLGDSTATIAAAQVAQAATVVFDNTVNGMDVNQVIVSTATDSAEESDNIINLGSGNDVLVLGTGALSNETIVISGFDQGKNTIVNFDSTAPGAANGGDWLNFNAYLTNMRSLSGSVESQQRIATTFDGNTTAEANSVSLVTGAFTTTDTFAGLTAAKLLAAINTTGNVAYAGIGTAMLDALTTYTTTAGATNLVGGIGKAVVMVANNLNVGEYAAFELTFNGLATNLNGDFTAAALIGIYDFGNAADFAGNIVA